MSHHIVEVQDLSYTYPDGTAAVRGLSFRIHHGESVAVVGANGAGKSTLLLHLNGYLTPQSGMVRIGDFPLRFEQIRKLTAGFGIVGFGPAERVRHVGSGARCSGSRFRRWGDLEQLGNHMRLGRGRHEPQT